MTKKNAVDILELLMEGIHPVTGEILPEDLLSDPDVIMALRTAIRVLRLTDDDRETNPEGDNPETKYLTKRNHLNAGRPWTPEDDRKLRELYESKTSPEKICTLLQRRARGVSNRLECLGLIQPEANQYGKPAAPGLERAGKPWYSEEDQKLRELFDQQIPIEQIAKAMGRSERSIQFRLERLRLIDNAENYPEQLDQTTRKDNDDLKRRYIGGQSIADIAACYHVTEAAIRARLFYLGLSKESPVPLPKTD